MLIERGGKIVTREEIRKRLWPNDTIVNFDHSINVAIGILRRAFGDSAENPQYIETLARRGYRLMVSADLLLTNPGPVDPDQANREQASSQETKPPSTSPAEMIGKRVSHYRVLSVIGGGGMGMVYQAEDLRLGRRVALKFLPPEVADDPRSLRRFEREAQTASALNHPNICTIYEIEEHEGQPFIVMELLEGRSLNHELDSSPSRRIPMPRLLEIALQICDGLQAAHERGIIHRDIKPANIFLPANGPAKILDFGLAKLVETEDENESASRGTEGSAAPASDKAARVGASQSLTLTGVAMGTAGYMSPEQVRRERLDVTTDLFSFGLVLYEAATGHRAFPGETEEIVHDAILHKTPLPARTINLAVPRRVDAIVSKAMEKERGRRYQSAAEIRLAIETVRGEVQPSANRRTHWIAGAVLFALCLLGISIFWRWPKPVRLSRNDTVVLAVSNETKDPVFDDAIYSGLFFDLQQTPYIHVLETDKLREALWELHLPDNARTPEIGRRVCQRTGSRMVIAASIGDKGNGFRIGMQAVDCQSGRVVAKLREDAPSRTQVIHALGALATQLRSRLGEPPSSISAFDKPLDEAMSSSPEAIQLLTDGYRHVLAQNFRQGAQDYQRAIGLDPNFAMAYVALAADEVGLDDHAASIVAAKKAFELRDRVTVPVRFNIEDIYYAQVTGQEDKDYAILTQWVRLFPDDFIGHNNLARTSQRLGLPDQSLAEAREAARLFPSPWSYWGVIDRAISTDRLDDAKAVFREADTRKFDSTPLRALRALLAFLQGDESTMEQQWKWAAGKPGADHILLVGRANGEAYQGHFSTYRDFADQAAGLAVRNGDSSDVSSYDEGLALQSQEVGKLSWARQAVGKALGMTQTPSTNSALALALARTGEIEQAQSLVDKINHDAPLNTLVQNYTLPTIRAAIKLQSHNPSEAIQLLRPTVKYDLSSTDGFNSLYPAYLRGEAYLQLREGRLAADEFQKLLDHPGLVGRNVIGALSRLQMARAQKLLGNRASALESYEDFLAIWRTADTDLPVFQQARAEYAALRSNSGEENGKAPPSENTVSGK
jgi:eukaryotic-like serine/threonine-protein kinase